MAAFSTRRNFLELAGGASLAAAAGLAPADARASDAELAKLYEAAKKEGSVTWWTAHYAQDAAEAAATAFKAKYPGIEVSFIRQTAQVVYQKTTQNLDSGVKELDVFASTDEAHYVALAKRGVLANYTPPDVKVLPPDLRKINDTDEYHLGAIGFVLLNYNPKKLPGVPHKWTGLTDAKLKGQITLGHPGYSGYVGNWVLAMNDKYGWDYFTKLAANDPLIGRSVNDTVTAIVSGERNVGAGPDNYSLEQKMKGNPIDIVYPDDDAILIVSMVGVMKDAPHPNAARLFTNFYYSKEYSTAIAKAGNFPLNPAVPPPGGLALGKVKYYRNKSDRLATGIPEVIAKWRQTFGV